MPSWLTASLYTIILLGAVQGAIMSGLLFFSKKQRYTSRLLACLIFIITLACFNLYGIYKDWAGNNIVRFIADLIPLVVIMPAGPLIYFYVQSYLSPAFRISKKQRLHFLPVIIDLGPTFIIIIYIIGLLFHAFTPKSGPAWGQFIDDYNVYADVPRWASITIYLWLSARHLAAFKAANGSTLPTGYTWLRLFLRIFLVFQAIWFVFLVPYVIPGISNKLLDAVDWYPVYIPLSIIIYWLGIKGYMASHTVAPVPKAAPVTPIPKNVIQQAIAQLEKAMQQDKLYLNPALNLDIVAKHTGLPAKTISAVLNQHVNKSFNEYVNGYRVEEFKEKVLLPQLDNLTIAGIANECGFNSQATFQRTFKQVTGMSPTAFRKHQPEMS